MASKATKQEAQYEPKASIPAHRCAVCRYFLPMYEKCKKIEGHVNPGAWCKFFEKK